MVFPTSLWMTRDVVPFREFRVQTFAQRRRQSRGGREQRPKHFSYCPDLPDQRHDRRYSIRVERETTSQIADQPRLGRIAGGAAPA